MSYFRTVVGVFAVLLVIIVIVLLMLPGSYFLVDPAPCEIVPTPTKQPPQFVEELRNEKRIDYFRGNAYDFGGFVPL